MRLALVLALVPVLAAAGPPDDVHVDFRKPSARRAVTLEGAGDSRFSWEDGGLRVALDSQAPPARAVVDLPAPLDGSADFEVEVDLVLESLVASPSDFFQLSFGLVNRATTGFNRTGTSLPAPPFFVDDADCFDSLELAYFPNVTAFGGPFLQPTVFGAESGGSAFWNFAANFGPSSDLGDNGAAEIRELPLQVPLRITMTHDACKQQLVTRVHDASTREHVLLATGILPLDLSFLNATGTFEVDAFAIHAWQDFADGDLTTRSLDGEALYVSARVDRLPRATARALPQAVNPAANGRAHVRITAPALVDPVFVFNQAGRLHSADCVGPRAGEWRCEVPRDFLVEPLVVDAGGCLIPVALREVP